MQAKQQNHKLSKESYHKALMKWHDTTQERLIHAGKGDIYDETRGTFLPDQWFNVDQSPLLFTIIAKQTYKLVKKGDRNHKVCISQPERRLEKLQCTLQVYVCPTGPQLKLAIIFRGKGKGVTQDEREARHKDVDVFFQENAGADTNGTSDDKISPEGLPNYVIPPPLTYLEPKTVGRVSNT